MPRYYGNLTGQPNVPSASSASGVWVSGTEVYRQTQTIGVWVSPPAPPPLAIEGSVLFAVSSGTRDELLATSNYITASGQAISRSTYSSLFSLYGTLYGAGDGVSTFNVPDYIGAYNYLKTTTTSGATLAQLSGVAVLPSHTHTVNGISTVYSQPTACGPSGNNRNMTATTVNVGNKGSANGNEARHRQVIPIIPLTTMDCPVGTVSPFLLPISEEAFASANIPPTFLICSGQDLSRTTYSDLFRQLGTLYGVGDGSTTFTLPDLTGRFLKNVGTPQVSGVLPSGYILDDFAQHSHTATFQLTNVTTNCPGPSSAGSSVGSPPTGASSVGSATENRPNNISVVYLINTG